MEKISLPVRILAIALVLIGAAGMLAMRTMGASTESTPIPLPVKKSQAAAKPAPTSVPAKAEPEQAKAAAGAPTAKAPKPRAPRIQPAKPKPVVNPVVPPTGFPVVVDKALRRHQILVVSLVVPGARVDELGAAEAKSGARLSGAGFLALNVLNEGVARALLSKLDGLEDPSVLVLKRSGEIALELDGFVDRETVAQAVANVAP